MKKLILTTIILMNACLIDASAKTQSNNQPSKLSWSKIALFGIPAVSTGIVLGSYAYYKKFIAAKKDISEECAALKESKRSLNRQYRKSPNDMQKVSQDWRSTVDKSRTLSVQQKKFIRDCPDNFKARRTEKDNLLKLKSDQEVFDYGLVLAAKATAAAAGLWGVFKYFFSE